MFGDNNDTANGQQDGNTPPPMTDSPMNSDSASDSTPPSAPPPLDPPADQQSGSASDFAMAGNAGDTTESSATQEENKEASGTNSDLLQSPGNDDLLNIKQQALQQLSPLVDHLEQTPDEEFRTTMMMIQATDNQQLVKRAFDAAQKIEDDKKRAQAFLDIINEINYFTQHHEQ